MKVTKRGAPTPPAVEARYQREAQFCTTHCPHAKASDCRWQVKQCMAQEKLRREKA